MDDRTAAELITRRLTESLSQQEVADLEQHLAESQNSQDFASLSQQIQAAVERMREIEAAADWGPGMSPVTRKRLELRLLSELSSIRKVAEDPRGYNSDTSGDGEP